MGYYRLMNDSLFWVSHLIYTVIFGIPTAFIAGTVTAFAKTIALRRQGRTVSRTHLARIFFAVAFGALVVFQLIFEVWFWIYG